MAAILSLIVPGLGQAWLGAARRGLFIVAPIVIGLAALLGYLAGGDRRQLLDTFLRPGVILVLLIAIIGLGIYHVLAIQDAYRLGLRQGDARTLWTDGAGRPAASRGRVRALLSPLLVAALAAAIAIYGTLTFVGVKAFGAAQNIFVKPDTGFVIPGTSFEPGATPSGPASSGPLPTGLEPPEPTSTPVPVPQWAADGRLNLLLIGSDAGPGRWSIRSDTMIVLSVDVASARAVMFGIPRNLINVPLPPESADAFPNGRYPGLLNSLYVYADGHRNQFPGGDAAGFRALTGAIQELVGVPLDGAIVVNLTGFVDLIDAVNGLWVDVPYTPVRRPLSGRGPARSPCTSRPAARSSTAPRRSSTPGRATAATTTAGCAASSCAEVAGPPARPDRAAAQGPEAPRCREDNLWTTIDQNEIANLAVLAAAGRRQHDPSRSMIEPPTYPEFLTTAAIRRRPADGSRRSSMPRRAARRPRRARPATPKLVPAPLRRALGADR